MNRETTSRRFLMVACLCLLQTTCGRVPLCDTDLLTAVEDFDRAVAGQARNVKLQLLGEQARDFKGKVLEVRGAVVASTYTRENSSHIYFGFNYDHDDHLFLSEIDPSLDERLANHRLWVSVVKTYPSRQLSFELPVTEQDFDRLEQGTEISFTCRIAALIRGKSVYCDSRDLLVNR